jgi:antirestriction protein ArdC
MKLAASVASSLAEGVVPWQNESLPASPVRNAASHRSYGGLNALYLMERCAYSGYKDPRFVTAKQANENGLLIRKGEHGTVLEHWTKTDDGKVTARGYSVFNVEQLNKTVSPVQESGDWRERAAAMLRNAGMDVLLGSSAEDFREAVKSLTVIAAEEAGFSKSAHTDDLLALRYSMASTALMREAGIPVTQSEGAPLKSWAESIRKDPPQLYKAARDADGIAKVVLRDMAKDRETELFRAANDRAEAQRGQELASEAATIPRGLDSNLPNADLSGVQEAIVTAADKAREQVNDLRASATAREANAGTLDKLPMARLLAKQALGDAAVVSTAQPGRAYEGKVIGVLALGETDKTAIQAVSDNHAVLHDIRNLSLTDGIKPGEVMSLEVDERGLSAVKQTEVQNLKREGLRR